MEQTPSFLSQSFRTVLAPPLKLQFPLSLYPFSTYKLHDGSHGRNDSRGRQSDVPEHRRLCDDGLPRNASGWDGGWWVIGRYQQRSDANRSHVEAGAPIPRVIFFFLPRSRRYFWNRRYRAAALQLSFRGLGGAAASSMNRTSRWLRASPRADSWNLVCPLLRSVVSCRHAHRCSTVLFAKGGGSRARSGLVKSFGCVCVRLSSSGVKMLQLSA